MTSQTPELPAAPSADDVRAELARLLDGTGLEVAGTDWFLAVGRADRRLVLTLMEDRSTWLAEMTRPDGKSSATLASTTLAEIVAAMGW